VFHVLRRYEIDWDLISQKDFPSPDGQRVATVFEMSCYCTTGDFPQLTVHRPGEKIGKNGNVLQGGPADVITVKWSSPTNLLVKFTMTRRPLARRQSRILPEC